jgi:hypothetical protein
MAAAQQYVFNYPMRDGLPVLPFGNALYFEHVKASSVRLLVLWYESGQHHGCRRGMSKDRGGYFFQSEPTEHITNKPVCPAR